MSAKALGQITYVKCIDSYKQGFEQGEWKARIDFMRENGELRDHFALAALGGFLANSFHAQFGHLTIKKVTEDCYRFADGMLEARKIIE